MPYPALPPAPIRWVGALSAGALDEVSALLAQALALVEGIYLRAPTLLLALSALVILPAVALVSVALRASARRRSRLAAARAAELLAQTAGAEIPEPTGAAAPLSQAWLTVDGASGTTALTGQLIRIGRHKDNDIHLADRSVHRHHAVIERTPDDAFLIKDVSGKDGNGVRVNGQRTEQARLADGDVIELGRARLRFENAPV